MCIVNPNDALETSFGFPVENFQDLGKGKIKQLRTTDWHDTTKEARSSFRSLDTNRLL